MYTIVKGRGKSKFYPSLNITAHLAQPKDRPPSFLLYSSVYTVSLVAIWSLLASPQEERLLLRAVSRAVASLPLLIYGRFEVLVDLCLFGQFQRNKLVIREQYSSLINLQTYYISLIKQRSIFASGPTAHLAFGGFEFFTAGGN